MFYNDFQVFFMCFISMLKLFHTDVAKVDRDVAYFAVVAHVYCKGLFPMFHLYFQIYVASLFIWMLHMCRSFTTDSLPRGYPGQYVRASAYAELDG